MTLMMPRTSLNRTFHPFITYSTMFSLLLKRTSNKNVSIANDKCVFDRFTLTYNYYYLDGPATDNYIKIQKKIYNYIMT